MKEYLRKEELIRNFMKEKGLDGILLSRRESFSWFTCGASNCVDRGSDYGYGEVLITGNLKYLISTNVESKRFDEEEVTGQGFVYKNFNWAEDRVAYLKTLIGNGVFGSDSGFPGTRDIYEEMKPVRYSLMPEEIFRMKELCQDSAEVMKDCCFNLKPGWTELDVDGYLTKKLIERNIEAPVVLAGSDERIFNYRHPVSSKKAIDKYVMIVLCARRHGLVAALTRLVHFGKVSQELTAKMKSVAMVDAAYILNTKIGTKISDIAKAAMAEYEKQGYPQEWTRHYQGGPIGYALREFEGTEYTHDLVVKNQAFAWNPTITGTKSEDTFLVTENGREFLTEMNDWPFVEVEYNGEKIRRHDILVR